MGLICFWRFFVESSQPEPGCDLVNNDCLIITKSAGDPILRDFFQLKAVKLGESRFDCLQSRPFVIPGAAGTGLNSTITTL